MTAAESTQASTADARYDNTPGIIDTFDPRTMQRTGQVPDEGTAGVTTALHRARTAFGDWSSRSYRERSAHVLDVRDLLLDRADMLIEVICAETGKLAAEAVMAELVATCETIEYYARHGERALAPERVPTGLMRHKRAMRVWEPMGVIGVIAPWNYPFTLAMTPTLTALFAGNTVVLKPSEVTPLVGLAIGALFADVGAHPGIVQVVTGGPATGEALVRSGVATIVFTGSVRTGKLVMRAAADTLTPVLLELGGKDPMIVCSDADLDRAAAGAVWGAFQNAGQTCMSVERVYVVGAAHEEFVDRVVARTARVRQGAGARNDIGSMTFPPQVAIVERHVADAVAKGARVLAGGQRPKGRPGLWYPPTVLVDVDHTMDVMRDETFGPVLPIMRVADDAEALRLANDSAYGLSASVWSASRTRAGELAARLEAGSVCINDCLISYAVPALPFGGVKSSGFGRIHGPDGLRRLSNAKALLSDRVGLAREAWWFPLPTGSARVGVALMRLRYRQRRVRTLVSHIGARADVTEGGKLDLLGGPPGSPAGN
ncbi:MAG: aldehyde dehydrogenase family protein [Acidimicrobiales bacterium]